MNPNAKYGTVMALLLLMPFVAYADTGSKSQNQAQMIQTQLAALTCKNSYISGYLNDVVSVINNGNTTATLTGTDIPKLGTDFSTLQSDANSGNVNQYKTDAKAYESDAKQANKDATSAIRTAHSKNISSTLKTDMKNLQSTYNTCMFNVKQQQAKNKVHGFDNEIAHVQNMTNKMSSHGANTTALQDTINQASTNVQAFETAVNNAQNSTQLQAALNSFCLYNGCKSASNFHFAAKTAIDADQAKLNLLSGKNSTASYQTLVSQAQTDLNNAQTALNQVGSSQYQGNQSNDVWSNIKAASDIIHQLQMASHKR